MAVNENCGSESTSELARRLLASVERRGPITFAEFMERALYDPALGYYSRSRSPWGRGGDYMTAPQVHSAVGAAIARLAAETDALLGRPDPLTLIEAGSGDGQLLADFCDSLVALDVNLYRRARLFSVERSAVSRERQRQVLERHAGKIEWVDSLSELSVSGIRGGIFSNELFDAMPVHRLTSSSGVVRELWVGAENGRFVERKAALSTQRLTEYLADNGIDLADGQVAEVSLAAGDWIETAAGILSAGFVLTIDYGAETGILYGPDRRNGSLVCQRRYQLSDNPFDFVGEQDISAHVDFGNLQRRGRELGLEPLGLESLRIFLVGLGAAEGSMIDPNDAEATRRHMALRHLLFSEIGEAHRVLLQVKGAESARLKVGRERLG